MRQDHLERSQVRDLQEAEREEAGLQRLQDAEAEGREGGEPTEGQAVQRTAGGVPLAIRQDNVGHEILQVRRDLRTSRGTC